MRELYHFTATHHLESILEEGRLRTTESNVGSSSFVMPPTGEHVGPDVLWLLDVPVLHHNHGLSMAPGSKIKMLWDKTEVRFTIRVEDAVPWLKWEPAQKMNPRWRKVFLQGAGGRDAARHWWVIEREVVRDEWLEIKTPSGMIDFSTRD